MTNTFTPTRFAKIALPLSAIFLASAEAKPVKSYFAIDPFESHVSVRLGYTLGTHRFQNHEVRGQLELHPNNELDSASVSFTVSGFKSDNPSLDCHLQESLGLDYSKSDFPDSHVCSDDRLPAKGKNSIAFPEVTFRSAPDAKLAFSEVGAAPAEHRIKGNWTIHGVSRPVDVSVTLQRQGNRIRAKGSAKLALKDFGITVKKFLFVTVNDEAVAEWDVVFNPESP